MSSPVVLDSVLRQDLASFVQKSFQEIAPAQRFRPNWHIQAITWHLEQCHRGDIKRLLITLPPRYLKSICASVAFPAWVLGRDPAQRIICASYSNELSAKHAGDCRVIMSTAWYKRAFPRTRLSRDKNTELNFVTTRRGFRFSTSVGGTLTGRGGNLIIVDDPLKPDEAMSNVKRKSVRDWFDRTLYTRLDDKSNDVIILIMQRLHIEDLAGHVLGDGGWTHLNLPAIAEVEQHVPIGGDEIYVRARGSLLHAERESQAVLDDLKQRLGSFNFSAQYQQSPIPEDGEIIKWGWFRIFDCQPASGPDDWIVQSWDTASKVEDYHDYSVCTTWLIQGDDYYLLDVERAKLQYPELKQRIIEHAKRWRAWSILIEDKGSGTGLIQDLRQHHPVGVPRPTAINPQADKITRMHIQSAKVEAGHVLLPARAGWLADFRSELMQFPNGRYDDQVDSFSQFLNWIDERKRKRMRVGQY